MNRQALYNRLPLEHLNRLLSNEQSVSNAVQPTNLQGQIQGNLPPAGGVRGDRGKLARNPIQELIKGM